MVAAWIGGNKKGMKMEDYVTLEAAKLLKEKGYSWPCDSFYTLKGLIQLRSIADNFNRLTAYSRPALYEAQKWLRTEHNIHIVIDNDASGYYWHLYKANNGTSILHCSYNGPNDGGCWDNYEEALSAGILESLKLIQS